MPEISVSDKQAWLLMPSGSCDGPFTAEGWVCVLQLFNVYPQPAADCPFCINKYYSYAPNNSFFFCPLWAALFVHNSPGSHFGTTLSGCFFFYMLQEEHWVHQDGACVLHHGRSLSSFPLVCVDVSRPPAASRHISAERWAKYCVSFTRPTSRAPPPSIRQGHTKANRVSL